MNLAHSSWYQSVLESPAFPLNIETVTCVYSLSFLAHVQDTCNCWSEQLTNLRLHSHIWSHFSSSGGHFSHSWKFKGYARSTESLTGTWPRTTLRDNFLVSAIWVQANLAALSRWNWKLPKVYSCCVWEHHASGTTGYKAMQLCHWELPGDLKLCVQKVKRSW